MSERVFPAAGRACAVEGCDPDRGRHFYLSWCLPGESGRGSLGEKRLRYVGVRQVAPDHLLARDHMVVGCEFVTVSIEPTGEVGECGIVRVRFTEQVVKVAWF